MSYIKLGCQAVLLHGIWDHGSVAYYVIIIIINRRRLPISQPHPQILQLKNFHFYIFYILNIGLWTRFYLSELNIPWLETWKLYFTSLNLVPEKGPRSFQKFKESDSRDHQLDYNSFKVIFAGKRRKKIWWVIQMMYKRWLHRW